MGAYISGSAQGLHFVVLLMIAMHGQHVAAAPTTERCLSVTTEQT